MQLSRQEIELGKTTLKAFAPVAIRAFVSFQKGGNIEEINLLCVENIPNRDLRELATEAVRVAAEEFAEALRKTVEAAGPIIEKFNDLLNG